MPDCLNASSPASFSRNTFLNLWLTFFAGPARSLHHSVKCLLGILSFGKMVTADRGKTFAVLDFEYLNTSPGYLHIPL
jgi:hypothetical protein